jgi:2,4-dienoyl-CoA reductase-like NADH-dependent reductase (Old Yellow Enzyme family)
MNERIRELVKHATVTHYHGMGEIDELNTEKFAELIVQECIDIVAAGGEFASRPKLVEKLQEHFGVEE